MSTDTASEHPRPFIQIDDEIREMTEEEFALLLASGWTEGDQAPS